MDSEEDLFRLPPPCPYEPVDLQLSVPDRALAATIALLRRAGHRESGLLWYGPEMLWEMARSLMSLRRANE